MGSFEQNDLSFILSPTVMGELQTIKEVEDNHAKDPVVEYQVDYYTAPVNATGSPAVVVPLRSSSREQLPSSIKL